MDDHARRRSDVGGGIARQRRETQDGEGQRERAHGAIVRRRAGVCYDRGVRTLCLMLLASAWPLAACADPPPPATPSTPATPPSPSPWALFRTPTANPPRAIGGYSAGCIDGAVALAKSGDGFRVAKPERNRVFGHPLLVGMIRDLGKRLVELHLPPLAVGDLGQPRG